MENFPPEVPLKLKGKFTVVIEGDEDDIYVARVPSLEGCHGQAKNLDTLMKCACEPVELCPAGEHAEIAGLEAVGIQQISA